MLVLVSDATQTCGVEEFARQAAIHAGAATHVLGTPGLREALAAADELVINLPVVAWKRRLLSPIAAAVQARMMGRGVTIVLHEWADLAAARRVSYLPLLPLATRLLFSAPEVMAQFAATPVSAVATKSREVIAVPPNFAAPEWPQGSVRAERLAEARAAGTLVLAQFGSIYPRKDPFALLEVTAELVRRGVNVRTVFIGSYVGDAVKAEVEARIAALGLGELVEVTGYTASREELYGLFDQVDVFLYPLSEGLTSRRASVLAAALSGRPVVVSAPRRADSLEHHELFKGLLKQGVVQLAPLGASPSALADAVLAARALPVRPSIGTDTIDRLWENLAARLAA